MRGIYRWVAWSTRSKPCRGTRHCAHLPVGATGWSPFFMSFPRRRESRCPSDMSLRGVPKSRDDAAISTLLCQTPLTNVILSLGEESRPPCPILSPLAGERRVRGIYRWVAWSIRSKPCRGTRHCAHLSVGARLPRPKIFSPLEGESQSEGDRGKCRGNCALPIITSELKPTCPRLWMVPEPVFV